MPFELNDVVPWGRNLAEYRAMFALSNADLAGRIIGCGDGPASFNSEATLAGSQVVSVDPIYCFTRDELARRIEETRRQVIDQARRNRDQFVWSSIGSIEELEAVRMAAMRGFLDDYETGLAAGRYLDGGLPGLPFEDDSFDLALCSHYLFLYQDQIDEAAHAAAIREMCRVASEARVFPLLALDAATSRHLDPVTELLEAEGYTVVIERVDYEFQRGGNQMLRIRRGER